MQIISGPDIDLISPFPLNQVHRIYGWMQCFKDTYITDNGPKDRDSFIKEVENYIHHMQTFAVIDRDNKLNSKHPVPLVGMLMFDQTSNTNSYIHFASTRIAHGTGIMDQAIQIGLQHQFVHPNLFRISAMLLANNGPAKSFLQRNGFVKECIFPGMDSQNGVPISLIHLAVLKDKWTYNPKPLRIIKD